MIGSTASAAVTYPYLAAVLTILYFDQRVRKEGFDLQLQAEGFGVERDPDAPLPAPLIGDELYTPEQRAARAVLAAAAGLDAAAGRAGAVAVGVLERVVGARRPTRRRAVWGSGRPPRRRRRAHGDPLRTGPDAHADGPARRRGRDEPETRRRPIPRGRAKPPAKDEDEKDDDDKPDRGRADWLPPEAPRGPGGL